MIDGTSGLPQPLKVLFCGNRELSVDLIQFMRDGGATIMGLGLNSPPFAESSNAIKAAAEVDLSCVFYGRSFSSPLAIRRFKNLEPDLGVCCGFASTLPTEMLSLPKRGWVNLHRSFLPYNRGLDPLQWALVDGTPMGVSLHVMTEEVDAGPVVGQCEFPVLPTDDLQSLTARADKRGLELFTSCWPLLERGGEIEARPQEHGLATYHSWRDCVGLRRLELDANMPVGRLLAILRGYSANGVSVVYYEFGGLRFTVHTRVEVSQLGTPQNRNAGIDEGMSPAAIRSSSSVPTRRHDLEVQPPDPGGSAMDSSEMTPIAASAGLHKERSS